MVRGVEGLGSGMLTVVSTDRGVGIEMNAGGGEPRRGVGGSGGDVVEDGGDVGLGLVALPGDVVSVLVFGLGVFEAVVGAAGFGAAKGAAGDQSADEEHVLDFPSTSGVEDFVEGVTGPVVDAVGGFVHVSAVALDADVSPHDGLE